MRQLKRMFKFCIVLVLLLTSLSVYGAAEGIDEAYIESIIQDRLGENAINSGIVVGLIDGDGKKIIGYGTAQKEDSTEVDGSTLFEIGSITKVLTSVILADMAEHGELNLDDPVSEHLPDSVNVPSKDGFEMTLQHLSSHTSGLPLWPTNLIDNYTAAHLYDFLSNYTLTREAGSQFEYSNLGAGLLGHILALKTGMESEDLFIDRICEPLNLHDTRITIEGNMLDRFATGHDMNGNAIAPTDISTNINILYFGAGALRSTVNDMLTFLAANMGIVETDLYPAMLETHIPRADANPPYLKTGLGWFVQNQYESEIIWHPGASYGFRSFIGFDKEKGLGVVVLTNIDREVQDIGMHLLNENYELAGTGQEVNIDADIFDKYEGMYEFAPGIYATVTRKGKELWVQFTGEPQLQVLPESETDFFIGK